MKEEKKNEELRLCYVEDGFAFFTTKNIKEQWGDDWNDAPYEHNAGFPYSDDKTTIVKIGFIADLDEPKCGHLNSKYSVEDINRGAIAWLQSPSYERNPIRIFAGATLGEFILLIKKVDGIVYFPVSL
jgi:hypothetical protein